VEIDVDTALSLQNIPREGWLCQRKYLNSLIIILIMDPNKMHEQVLEIQKNITGITPEQQTEMLGELLDLVSKLEQSLSEIKLEIDEE
jgi:hypothetical protein